MGVKKDIEKQSKAQHDWWRMVLHGDPGGRLLNIMLCRPCEWAVLVLWACIAEYGNTDRRKKVWPDQPATQAMVRDQCLRGSLGDEVYYYSSDWWSGVGQSACVSPSSSYWLALLPYTPVTSCSNDHWPHTMWLAPTPNLFSLHCQTLLPPSLLSGGGR